ncbi:hypothetical protein J4050_05255 [Winogradskyella sp. DF17]|jgi:hypothetical protein|uniref:Letm1 RBD domain-containing protein n=1 Tax=Winogradskyella pelagia TaxID=2819984 RepID=A0ABS3T074_9FLAO|nr:LETM1-related biofilm-associated protein [Winogradskyella sp. DF17]MBO3116143.1 hypothetical protein [Winogradskyella sp. DF17]
MNPSANGWIKKLLNESALKDFTEKDDVKYYNTVRSTGFIYGTNINLVTDIIESFELSEEERCKINLLLSFFYMYENAAQTINFEDSLIDYYKTVSEQKRSFFEDLFSKKSTYGLLEDIIHKRIHIDDNFLAKSFNYFLINALLFVDVLGYKHYLDQKKNTKTYVNTIESSIETIVFSVIEAKQIKSEYDDNLIRLFKSSVRHKNSSLPSLENAIDSIKDPLEKWYVIDLVCMASWSDKVIDKDELEFLNKLKASLDVDFGIISNSIDSINTFYEDHKNDVAFLSSKNLAQSLYDNSSKVVTKLIKRNSKRLIKELTESKEALALLAKSTQRNLTDEEQKKVQTQLMDIFKSIPSLAIFMLPGGMLLMPLFVKFIPKLLPSAFDENRIDKKKEN